MSDSEGAVPAAPRPRGVRIAKWLLRGVIFALVIIGITRTTNRARRDLERQEQQRQSRLAEIEVQQKSLRSQEATKNPSLLAELERERKQLLAQRFSWQHLSLPWTAACGVIYLLACIPCWIFWHDALRALGQHPTALESLRAYYIGHLGKYVPGKALVVVMRTGLVRGRRVDTYVAVASVFIETLTLMAVGAALSAALLVVQQGEGRRWIPWAVALMLCAALPTIPAVFRRIVRRMQPRQVNAHLHTALDGLDMRLMVRGWILMALSWVGMGLSLWAAVRAMPAEETALLASLADLPVMIACIGLAVVLGFVSLMPGGFGVRELVVSTLLAPLPHVGVARALGAAVVLRLAWLLAEVIVSIILYTSIRGPETAVRISPARQVRAEGSPVS